MPPADPRADDFSEQIAAAGAAFGQAQVEAIYCVHGTFAGNDALGLLTELARFTPGLSSKLRRFGKRTVDLIAGETGNYTPRFVATFQEGVSAGAGRTIPVRLFNWSSQNNHIGRADGAIRFIYELAKFAATLPRERLAAANPPRVLLWGHSHGGNVFALATSLLAAERAQRDEFFHAARTFYRPWFWGEVDLPVWRQVRELLDEVRHPLRQLALDIATFGTPIRYGWDAGGYARLLHFIHHRLTAGEAEYLAPPLNPRRALSAAAGDYVQQFGIAGSNLAPAPFALRTFLADWRLNKFLERDIPRERLIKRLGRRQRVPDAGTTLLVDYSEVESGVHQHLAGHALYTRRKWLPFHCREIAKRFYRSDARQ
ncbi:MAG: hypothetical protein MI725_00650 [Pirellulales bacterium]|nr:hypothetical protein [Pirellulales bacterium]